MKKLILVTLLALSTNAFAAKTICGVNVQDDHIRWKAQPYGVNYLKILLQEDKATIRQCFTDEGAAVVGIFRNGEVRAYMF